MTEPESNPLDPTLDPESPTDEATSEVSQDTGEEGSLDTGEEGVAADYQTRMEEFYNVDTAAPTTSVVTAPGQEEKSDVEV